jgi:hypothetical protein
VEKLTLLKLIGYAANATPWSNCICLADVTCLVVYVHVKFIRIAYRKGNSLITTYCIVILWTNSDIVALLIVTFNENMSVSPDSTISSRTVSENNVLYDT